MWLGRIDLIWAPDLKMKMMKCVCLFVFISLRMRHRNAFEINCECEKTLAMFQDETHTHLWSEALRARRPLFPSCRWYKPSWSDLRKGCRMGALLHLGDILRRPRKGWVWSCRWTLHLLYGVFVYCTPLSCLKWMSLFWKFIQSIMEKGSGL